MAKTSGVEQAKRFHVGQTVLVPCEVTSVDLDDDMYPVKLRIPSGVVSGRDERWLHVRDLPRLKVLS